MGAMVIFDWRNTRRGPYGSPLDKLGVRKLSMRI